MGRFDAMLAKMRKDADTFEKVRGIAEGSYKSSTADLRALIAKVDKYQAKLDGDAKQAKDFVTFITYLEKGLPGWEQLLTKVKGMKPTDDFSPYNNQSSGALAGKLDPKKPLQPQVIDKIESFLDKELERAKVIEKNQQVLVARWVKHQGKHIAAVKAVKQINDSLGAVD